MEMPILPFSKPGLSMKLELSNKVLMSLWLTLVFIVSMTSIGTDLAGSFISCINLSYQKGSGQDIKKF
jgi:hypothetical protein